jgi:hypothetical protein
MAETKGKLEISKLKEILKKRKKDDYDYPKERYEYIIKLMKKFELCYEMPEDNRVLIPDLQDVQEPHFDFDDKPSLRFYFQYDFLPKSIMPRFMVRMHKDIKQDLRWRTGVVLEDRKSKAAAVVKSDQREKKISFSVIGDQKRDYFAFLRKTIEQINDSFEKMPVTRWVPLPDEKDFAVEYEELLGHEKSGRDEIFIGKLQKSYSVSQLLNGIEKPEVRKKRYAREKQKAGGKAHTEIGSVHIHGGTVDIADEINK